MKPGHNRRQRGANSHWTMGIQWYRSCTTKLAPLLSYYLAPSNCFTGFRPVACLTSASRRSAQVLV